jgi:hypothetical protein
MGGATPRLLAGHGVPCPYKTKLKLRAIAATGAQSAILA